MSPNFILAIKGAVNPKRLKNTGLVDGTLIVENYICELSSWSACSSKYMIRQFTNVMALFVHNLRTVSQSSLALELSNFRVQLHLS